MNLPPKFEIEFAIWHPKVGADLIEIAVGLKPKISWTVGAIRRPAAQPEDRTYCRFHLGIYSQDEISEGLQMLKPFENIASQTLFHDGKGISAVYIKDLNDAAEVHLNLQCLETLRRLQSSVVFR